MKYIVTINGKKYEVEVEKSAELTGQILSKAETRPPAPVSSENAAEDRETKREKRLETSRDANLGANKETSPSQAPGEGERLESPLPGTISSMGVKEGQNIKQGEVLCILEAMKMENEIMAPRDGIVLKILVSAGTNVKTGDLLFLLK